MTGLDVDFPRSPPYFSRNLLVQISFSPLVRCRRPRGALVSNPRNKIGFPQAMRTKLRYPTYLDVNSHRNCVRRT